MALRLLFTTCIVCGALMGMRSAAQVPDPEASAIPATRTTAALESVEAAAGAVGSAQKHDYVLPPEFYAALKNHPRYALERRAREAVRMYEKHHNQYIRCRLNNGTELVGFVSSASEKHFNLETSFFKSREISYRELESDPVPVGAGGQKFVRGMQITGMVTVVVLALPILIPYWTLACASGSCPD